MILFVFEGIDREPKVYKTLERLYFPKENDNIICSFGNNIYDLYNKMMEYDGDGDIVSIMRERLSERGDLTLENIRSTDVSEVFLFFDYDFQNSQLSLDEINRRVGVMLQMFDDETGNGKLYINYPMVESICYTKELPDEDYCNYAVTRSQCRDFKCLAREFSYYDSFDHILFKAGEKPTKEKYLKIKENWDYLKMMNVGKANLLVKGVYDIPKNKCVINQLSLFNSQLKFYVVNNESVAVLNSFPIFIYDYLKNG
ncbi:MAG: hypothetical protein ACI308_03080 [Muribaculaceae bacterium]